jgi:DNA recombination-dependent growth factor C
LITDLLPKAFVKPSRTDALIDVGLGVVAIDTSSRKAGENVKLSMFASASTASNSVTQRMHFHRGRVGPPRRWRGRSD